MSPQYPFLPVSVPVIIRARIDGVWGGIDTIHSNPSYHISAIHAPLGVGGFTQRRYLQEFQGSHFLDNHGILGNSVLSRISVNFAVWREIFCGQMTFVFVTDNKRND